MVEIYLYKSHTRLRKLRITATVHHLTSLSEVGSDHHLLVLTLRGGWRGRAAVGFAMERNCWSCLTRTLMVGEFASLESVLPWKEVGGVV